MLKLFLAEIHKIKRMKIINTIYIGILFSMFLTSAQLKTRLQIITFEQLASMAIYNHVLLVLPFCLSLVGGYMIDREYTQNTQKNLLTIPVQWSCVILAKILVMLFLCVGAGVFANLVLVITGFIINCSQISAAVICRTLLMQFISHICVLIGVLPIILWFSKTEGKYLWGAALSLLLGVSGIFAANGLAANWHPITYCFSMIQSNTVNTSVLNPPFSCIAMVIYILLAVMVFVILYGREVDTL